MDPGYRILEHPADIGIESWGDTFSAALTSGVEGLAGLLVDPATVDPRETRTIIVTATDYESLAVKTLSEVLYLFDGENFVPRSLDIESAASFEVRAKLFGEPLRSGKHHMRLDVKAVTYHQVSVEFLPHSVRIRLFLDI